MNPATKAQTAKEGELEVLTGRDAPAFERDFVQRPRLLERLTGSSAAMVLLTAPAGYSKTTCLSEWAAADERPFVWVAATARHDDPALLVTAIVEALNRIEPVDPGVLMALASPRPSISRVVLPRLGNSLRTRNGACVLVIDDVHALSAEAAFEVIETVVESLPTGSQVAVASRSEPPLPLGRMRASRRLIELTQRDLAMTRAESGELLANIGLDLSPSQLETLFARTEGWPAALYLAGLTLLDQADLSAAVTSFAGDDRIVVDYLRDEFLSATSPARVKFLIRTAVLDQLSGPLCDMVLQRSGSGEVLKKLSRSNFLVVPLDRNDDRYRYHHLFGEMLRSELRRREPEDEAEIHARASRWYAANSDAERAIEHAIAAGEVDGAAELIWDAFAEVVGRGRIATIQGWLRDLGAEKISSSSKLALAAAHYHLAAGEGDRAAQWVRVAEGATNNSAKAREAIRADVHLLNATCALDGVVQMGKDAARASELLPAEVPWQTPCYLYRGVSSHLRGHPERAVPLLEEAARRGAIVIPVIQVIALSQLCLIAIEDDDWESASRRITQAREQVQRCGLTDYPSILIVHAASSLVRSHDGQVIHAEGDAADTRRLLSLLRGFPPWYEAQARIVLAQARARLDDVAGGQAALDEAAHFLERTADAVVLSDWLKELRRSLKAASSEGRRQEWSLTTAELRTLQYLPSHLSFREIGERIHVSPNTVKTQAQAVYRKLEASSRNEAVERARRAGLLGEDPLIKG